jgi:hypothetical protein
MNVLQETETECKSPLLATSLGNPGKNVACVLPETMIRRNFSALELFDINFAKLFRLAPPEFCQLNFLK